MISLVILLSCVKPLSKEANPDRSPFTNFPQYSPALGKRPSWEGCCLTPQNARRLRPLAETGAMTDLVGGILCDVVLDPKKAIGASWDLMSGKPDPTMTLTVDGVDKGYVTTKNTFESSMSWPALQLHSGSTLAVYVEDLDLHHNDFVGQDDSSAPRSFF